MIYVLEDDDIMAECLLRACQKVTKSPVQIFPDALLAMAALSSVSQLPALIFLDILLTGPDGFTFLNELVSYQDTAQIPVVIVSSVNLKGQDLTSYGVVGILDKSTMTPEDIKSYVKKYVKS